MTHGVTYEGPGKKLEIIQLKKRREINLKKLKKKIMKELDLDYWFHDIKIKCHAPHAVFSDCIIFTPIEIKGDKHVKIIFDRINSIPQLKAAEMYISVEPHTEVGSEDLQQKTLEGRGGEEYNHYIRMVIHLLPQAPQLEVLHYHVMRHQLQWRIVDLVINMNIFNL